MAFRLPNGAIISIASAYGALATISAFTNATPNGVMTLSAGHGILVGDVFELTSGWLKANNQLRRALAVSTNDITVEGLDTSNTGNYPPTQGVGSIREITAWTQIPQVIDTNTSGGEQQFTTVSFLENSIDFQLPTTKSPQTFTLTVADDPNLAYYALLVKADDDRLQRAIRFQLPGGSVLYYNAFVTFNPTPTTTKNEVMSSQVTFSLTAIPTRYAS